MCESYRYYSRLFLDFPVFRLFILSRYRLLARLGTTKPIGISQHELGVVPTERLKGIREQRTLTPALYPSEYLEPLE
jgi:hypothetical protein